MASYAHDPRVQIPADRECGPQLSSIVDEVGGVFGTLAKPALHSIYKFTKVILNENQ